MTRLRSSNSSSSSKAFGETCRWVAQCRAYVYAAACLPACSLAGVLTVPSVCRWLNPSFARVCARARRVCCVCVGGGGGGGGRPSHSSCTPPPSPTPKHTNHTKQTPTPPHHTTHPFFKQKTAYEIMSGDWSSDVCSSD
eukprot:COSAG06_NODE_21654_length_748_cov_29.190769_1_plen_138_part_10